MSLQYPFISVIIPHFNDQDRLARCLERLQNQSYPTDCFEILVVDNGSTVLPDSLVQQCVNGRLLVEMKPGSYAARNRGISEAKGELLAFTDSDCLPELNWLENGRNAINSNERIGLVAGAVTLFAADPKAANTAEIYEQLTAFPIANYVRFWHFGATANLFARRDLVAEIGGFDETFKSGGDVEWGQRFFAAGYEIVYAADVVIHHPALASERAIYHKQRRVVGGHHNLLAKNESVWWYLLKGFPKDIVPPLRKSQELWAQKQYSPALRLRLMRIEWGCNYWAVFERLRLLGGRKTLRD